MQTLFLVPLGLLLGSALIVGAVRLAIYPPGFLRKPLLAAPIDRPDMSDGTVTHLSSCEAGSGDSC